MATIPLFKVFMSPHISASIINTLSSGFITQGPRVQEFEEKLAIYFQYQWILTLNSATSGLTLALRLLKDQLHLDETDEVLCTPLTCTATNWPVLATKLRIKWVDVDSETCNMDLQDLKRKITRNTKLILFVHWGGYPVDLEKVQEIQDYTFEKYGFRPLVIEDCAHAFGAKYNNRFIGTHGNIAVFSLQAIKQLTTGDGGLIFLPNKELYEKAKLLRWYGIDREQRSGSGDFRLEPDIVDWGYKFHMNDINATIGIENLKYISSNLEITRANAQYYFEKLEGIVKLPQNAHNRIASWWIFTIRIKNKAEFMKFMKERNIITSQVHNRNDIHSCVKDYKIILSQLDILEKEIVAIPVGWWIGEHERKYIVDCIKEFTNLKSI
jgi:dTDP-4-amino-4,6-dideoxygalactose transaminase